MQRDARTLKPPARGPGARARHGLGAADDGLDARVAAALRRHLVLDHDARRADLRVAAHRARDVARVAVARVAVGDERDRLERGGDDAAAVLHLAVAHEARVGVAPGRGDAEARHEGQLEAGPLHEARRDAVVAAGHRVDAAPAEQRPQLRRGRRGRERRRRRREEQARDERRRNAPRGARRATRSLLHHSSTSGLAARTSTCRVFTRV